MPKTSRPPDAPLTLPAEHQRLLLHSCCAPCAGDVMKRLKEAGVLYTLYFYNPNIHPKKEYLLRKQENIRFADELGVPFIDADYDPDRWFEAAEGMEDAPERGIRCSMCFEMRLLQTAQFAKAHNFTLIATVLGISRWKDLPQIDAAGRRAVGAVPGVAYWDHNWRKQGGANRMLEISKEQGFYQQEYCGCAYSLRDTNRHRLSQGRDRIKIGQRFYSPETAPS